MANPPVEGDSTSSTVPGVTGTNNAPAAGTVIVVGGPQPTGESAAVHGNSQYGPGVHGVSGEGNGVHGSTGSGNSGVIGENTGGGNGVYGTSVSGNAVAGQSQTGNAGWFRSSGAGAGVYAESQTGSGVVGQSTSGSGVTGSSTFGTGIAGTSQSGVGVLGDSTSNWGIGGTSQSGAGVVGNSNSNNGVAGYSKSGSGVAGESTSGAGVWAKGTPAGYFDGNVTVTGTLTVDQDIVLTMIGAGDCAEEFDVASPGGAEPGTVMVLGDDEALYPSSQPYDRRVAGVVSGGGDYRPALVLDRRESSRRRSPVALVGKVCCKVDARAEPIKVGDLLTTSPTPGHAMKASDQGRAFGAVIGKALQPLAGGQGLIPILVALQ